MTQVLSEGGTIRSHLTVLLPLLLLVVSAAEFFSITLQKVTPWTRVMRQSGLMPHQVGSQAQLLLQGGSLQVRAAYHPEVTVLQRPRDKSRS